MQIYLWFGLLNICLLWQMGLHGPRMKAVARLFTIYEGYFESGPQLVMQGTLLMSSYNNFYITTTEASPSILKSKRICPQSLRFVSFYCVTWILRTMLGLPAPFWCCARTSWKICWVRHGMLQVSLSWHWRLDMSGGWKVGRVGGWGNMWHGRSGLEAWSHGKDAPCCCLHGCLPPGQPHPPCARVLCLQLPVRSPLAGQNQSQWQMPVYKNDQTLREDFK